MPGAFTTSANCLRSLQPALGEDNKRLGRRALDPQLCDAIPSRVYAAALAVFLNPTPTNDYLYAVEFALIPLSSASLLSPINRR